MKNKITMFLIFVITQLSTNEMSPLLTRLKLAALKNSIIKTAPTIREPMGVAVSDIPIVPPEKLKKNSA